MKVLIKNSKYGYMYQIANDKGFTYFPDNVTTIADFKKYFASGGHTSVKGYFDEPDIIFCNQAGQPAKIYTIKPGEKEAGHRVAKVDYDKKFIFDDLASDSEKLEFLRFHLPEDPEAEKLESDKDKVSAYLKNADGEIKIAYKNMINGKLTNEVMIKLCEKNTKDCYSLPAEVIFLEK